MKDMIALTGLGYDIHRFAEAPRPLMLGGVHIPSARGLDGHSDADVLCHAIADALLGAAGLPDIGYWFPPGDPGCKDISSLDIVAKAVSLIRERGGRVVNVDSSLIAEAPAHLSLPGTDEGRPGNRPGHLSGARGGEGHHQ